MHDDQQATATFLLSDLPSDKRRNSMSSVKNKAEETPWVVPFPLSLTGKIKKNQNSIRTAKYTIWTFLPLQIVFQFRRFYNLYFLLSALTVISGFSSLSPIFQVMPLLIVFFFSAAKEAIEDWSRYTSDKTANAIQYSVIRHGAIEKIASKNIIKGDIFYIEKGEKVPVDAVLISSSYDDGTCFLETADLDGESNLKRRCAVTETALFNTPSRISRLAGRVECEQPNINLNVFNGRLIFDSSKMLMSNRTYPEPVRNSIAYPTQNKPVPLNMDNILLRGTVLQNTDFAYGLVIYTGLNTKIMKNLKKAKQKTSTLESRLNYFTLCAFAYNALLLGSSVVLEYVQYADLYNQETENKRTSPNNVAVQWYLGEQDTDVTLHVVKSLFSFFVIYTYVIPISLFVTLEISRLFQGRFMRWDKQMRVVKEISYGKKQKMFMSANNTNLNEELGAVEYIFSDKTGTLTQNDMRASRWFIGGKVFNEMEKPGSCLAYLRRNGYEDAIADDIVMFVKCLTLCHSVIPALNEETQKLIYESQSPDESALLNAMSNTNSILQSRSKTHIIIENHLNPEFKPVTEKYEHLAVLEFNSDRKRMSVIVRGPDGKIMLFCKGADNIILERLSQDHSSEMIEGVNNALTSFSVDGLRTLCAAYKNLTKEEWETFKEELDEAESSLIDREKKIGDVAEMIESNMTLVGCTAIEDRLQDEVPETISFLLKMGIKLWLLTGDKMETAINIGMSSKLLSREMNIITIKSKCKEEFLNDIASAVSQLSDAQEQSKINALVINGEALEYALHGNSKDQFLALGVRCHSVICCRVTPLQKALVVKLAKANLKCVTLAIGDGANDVSMIQSANIGIGIQGREGAQAVRAADYSFSEFRFLKRLLSVHGRYSYHRLCQLIFISFYKNIAMITVQWWFGFVSGWSGQPSYEEIFLTVYNVIFTSLPPFVLAIFDKDIPEEQINRYPQLYIEIKNGLYWNWKIITGWVSSALWHNSVIFGTVYLLNSEGVIGVLGRNTGYWVQCYLFGTPLLVTIMLKTAIVTRYWTWFSVAAISISMLLNLIVMFILVGMGYTEVGTPVITHQLFSFYLLTLLSPVICCLPDFTVVAYKRLFNPSDADIMLEESAIHKKKGRVEACSSIDEPFTGRPLHSN